MMTMRMGTFVSAVGLALALTPSDGHTQAVADPAGAEVLEAEAARIQGQRSRWADAVSLYRAAAERRALGDPQARQDLFLAADLAYRLGDFATAVDALESAGDRAAAVGDALFATEMFANAADIAEEAGMADQVRRLRTRVAELATAADAQRSGRS